MLISSLIKAIDQINKEVKRSQVIVVAKVKIVQLRNKQHKSREIYTVYACIQPSRYHAVTIATECFVSTCRPIVR